MPEGDTIHVAAGHLRKVLSGQIICAADGRAYLSDVSRLVGSCVNVIEARGKHLLMHLENSFVLHSHMGMTGSWHIYGHRDRWQKPQQHAHLSLKTSHRVVVCFTPKQLRLLTGRQLAQDVLLQRLGPDLLGPPVENSVLIGRFRTQNTVPVGQAVMNQTVVSGIGNVYKSECLFLCQMHPMTLVAALSDERLLQLKDTAISLMRMNLDGRPRITRLATDGVRHWVYGRQNEACLKCGNSIRMIRQGEMGRTTYFCPTCQSQP